MVRSLSLLLSLTSLIEAFFTRKQIHFVNGKLWGGGGNSHHLWKQTPKIWRSTHTDTQTQSGNLLLPSCKRLNNFRTILHFSSFLLFLLFYLHKNRPQNSSVVIKNAKFFLEHENTTWFGEMRNHYFEGIMQKAGNWNLEFSMLDDEVVDWEIMKIL